MQNLIGHQLGSYRLIRLIGRGGYANVYLGEHVWLGTQAAVKVLNTVVTSVDAEKFLREAQIIASLNHPHIIRLIEYAVLVEEEDQSPAHPLSQLSASRKEPAVKPADHRREVLPVPLNPFAESWAAAKALVANYQRVIEGYYQAVAEYEKAKNEQAEYFYIEQKKIKDQWVASKTKVSTAVKQVEQASHVAEQQLKKGRWYRTG